MIDHAFAGNEQRAGQAGAGELLINPWASSSGWGSVNISSCTDVEAMYLNVAGIAHTKTTSILLNNTNYLTGSSIAINSFGITQRVGKSNVLGLSILSMNFGKIDITTTDMPDGGIGYFNPQNLVLGLAFGHEFSEAISAGLELKMISEGISDVKANGIAIDAGINYIAPNNKFKFGVTIKNVGPAMRYTGNGLSLKMLTAPDKYSMSIDQRSQNFELPSLFQIGGSYDFILKENQHLVLGALFTSNSFTNDQYSLGLEYGLRNQFFVRGGYVFENNSINSDRTTFFVGPSAGVGYHLIINKEKHTKLQLNYSYRVTNPFNGVHSIGLALNL